jgi:hypothetical protein
VETASNNCEERKYLDVIASVGEAIQRRKKNWMASSRLFLVMTCIRIPPA